MLSLEVMQVIQKSQQAIFQGQELCSPENNILTKTLWKYVLFLEWICAIHNAIAREDPDFCLDTYVYSCEC